MTLNILEKLAATNPECEIWFDSSPLVYENWKRGVLEKAPEAKRADWEEQLTRLLDPETVRKTGKMGFGGVTTNPPLSLQAIQNDPEFWVGEIHRIAAENPKDDVEGIYWKTYLEVSRQSALMILPVYEASDGRYGHVSGQVDPRFVSDYDRMLSQGLELSKLAPNLMVKIPGSAEGYRVIEELTARGISTNNTTSFTVPQYMACMNAVSRGLERARAAGIDLSRWRSVITHMSARLGNIGDLKAQAEIRGIDLSPQEILLGEMAVLKRAYRHGKDTGHPSKMLQCSMRVIDEGEGGKCSSGHIQMIAGGDFVYTCPPSYIAQLMQAEDRMEPFDARAIDEDAPAEVIEKLMRLPYFRQAYEFDGMQPEEFARFGAFAATATEFAAATRKTVDFVASAIERARPQAA
ncbi:transaldolase family protein [Ovoidimarina sediminis]|uniref:transaldolase family protein n=1 Tax=Ovoidimarina sediminis TaxID=3079856 RepID=UPI00290C2A4D|nr:transaldolase family protein [Rhodophyticola sp. MJ-SS7]MDU8946421.1 transaldolase family protein [Rhodophyticola sp. MJ-SS7]